MRVQFLNFGSFDGKRALSLTVLWQLPIKVFAANISSLQLKLTIFVNRLIQLYP